MAFEIGVGANQTVRVDAPERAAYSDNLGGALQYGAVNSCYKLLEVMGGALGAFVAGVGVQFMERIEPSLVHYAKPLLDMLLGYEELDPTLRTFFQELREPQFEGATAILGSIAGQAGSAVFGTLLGGLLSPIGYAINRKTRNALLDVGDIVSAYRRGVMTSDDFQLGMSSHGLTDAAIDWTLEITQSRAGVGDLITGYKRGTLPADDVVDELTKRGVSNDAISVLLANSLEILDVSTLIMAWHRKYITEQALRDELSTRKYKTTDVDTILKLSHPLPGANDLVRMGVREAFRDDIAQLWGYDQDYPPHFEEYMTQLGFDPQWAKYYWRAHWALPSVNQGFEMMHRGAITADEMQTLLRVSDIPERWRRGLTDISWTPYTRVDVRRMYGLGVLSEREVKESYTALGYDDEKAENMTQFTVLYEKGDGTSSVDEYKELTRTIVLQAFKKGLLDNAEATTRLMTIGYSQEDIGLLLELTTWTKEIEQTPDYQGDYAKDVKSILEKAYSRRLISHGDAVGALTDLGYGETESEYILASVDFWFGLESLNGELKAIGDAYTDRAYNRSDTISKLGKLGIPAEMQTQVLTQWDSERTHRSRRLTESQYRKALGQELITLEYYQEALRGLGYSDGDIWILSAMATDSDKAGPRPQVGLLP